MGARTLWLRMWWWLQQCFDDLRFTLQPTTGQWSHGESREDRKVLSLCMTGFTTVEVDWWLGKVSQWMDVVICMWSVMVLWMLTQYRDEIHRPTVISYTAATGDAVVVVVVDNDCWPHWMHLVNEFLPQESSQHMDWPGCSLDTSCTEHICNVLRCLSPPLCVQHLEIALMMKWHRTHQ